MDRQAAAPVDDRPYEIEKGECVDDALVTRSIGLRALEQRDIETAARWGLDDVFCRAAEWNPDQTLEDHHRRWTGIVTAPSDELIRLGVVLADDRLVGYVDLYGDEPSRRELGFVIGDRTVWGKGIGTIAASLMLDHGFDDLRLATITAQAWNANERSVGILRRLGMRETGRGDTGEYCGTRTYYRQFEITASGWHGMSRKRGTSEYPNQG